MNNIQRYLLLTLAALVCLGTAHAQEDRSQAVIASARHGLEYEVKAGISIGGTSPLPLPEEIRKIEGFSPTFCFAIEGDAVKWFDRHWGLLAGLRFETKGMETKANVKNYGMEITGDAGERVSGCWTGMVKTKYRSTLATVPVLVTFQANRRLRVHAGPYISVKLDGDFSGYVFDGYLREGDPTGNKVEFTDGRTADYDFSEELRPVQYGIQAGVNWRAFKHLTLSGDLSWGLNDVFRKDFSTIAFPMYPIYVTLGFGYAF